MNYFSNETLIRDLNVSREIISSLKEYQNLVLKWNSKINLIAYSTINDFWQRHIIDSLQLLKFIENKNISIIDIGSGAGFPGMVLSISGVKKTTLIDSDSKKSAFLLQASIVSSNKVCIVNDRVEKVKAECNILTSRACASVNNIFEICQNIIVKDKFLLLKGENCKIEIEEAMKGWKFDYTIYNSITSSKGCILEIKNLVKTYDS